MFCQFHKTAQNVFDLIYVIWSTSEPCEARLSWVSKQQVTYNLGRLNQSHKKECSTCRYPIFMYRVSINTKGNSQISYEPITTVKRGLQLSLHFTESAFYSPAMYDPKAIK